MRSRISGAKGIGLLAAVALVGTLVMWRRWTNHDVSDPGVTL
jgi:hypothetical protein